MLLTGCVNVVVTSRHRRRPLDGNRSGISLERQHPIHCHHRFQWTGLFGIPGHALIFAGQHKLTDLAIGRDSW